MRDVLNQFFGGLGGPVIQMIGGLLIVVVLIVVVAWVVRRVRETGGKQPTRRGDRPTQRLAVVDAAHVDGQRRLVLVRRDDVEHLVMIGGPNDVLIEPRIVRGQPLGGQRAAPQAAPYPTAQPVAPPVAAQQPQQQPRPVRATAEQQPQPQQQTTAGQPAPVPMPPPFVEAVTSPATHSRSNPVAADLRAAMGDGRRPDDYVDTQRDPYTGRQPTAPQPQMMAPPPVAPPMAPARPQSPVYDEPTVAARPAYAEPTAYTPPSRPAPSRPAPEPTPAPALSLEDMVAAGLEQAISRPDPVPTRASRSTGPAFGQRVEPSAYDTRTPASAYDTRTPASAYDTRTPAKDAVAAEIEKAIYGLTAPGAGVRPQTGRAAPPPARREPERPHMERPHMERPTGRLDRADPGHAEPTVPVSRMPPAAPPVFPRPQPAPARPTLVAQQQDTAPEPMVAVLPQPDAVRGDARADAARRSSSDIEDEMARLLSELTGTAGR